MVDTLKDRPGVMAPPPLLYLLPLALVVVQKGVIAREEAYLERKFGEDYLNYKARVQRWI